MRVDEVQSWCRAPVPEQPWLDMVLCQRLLEQRIVIEIDLADRQVIGGAPVRVDQCPFTSTDVMDSLLNTKKSPLRSSLFAISSITTPDPDTAVVQLNKPTAGDFLWALSYIDGTVYPPSPFATAATDADRRRALHPEELSAGFRSILLAKNPKYWDSKAYPLGGVDFVQVTHRPAGGQRHHLGRGRHDRPRAPELHRDQAQPEHRHRHHPVLRLHVMQPRQNTAPFNNPKVRAALEYAVDRQAINKAVFAGLGEPAYQPFPQLVARLQQDGRQQVHLQPAKAKAMLAAAGFTQGVSSSSWSSRPATPPSSGSPPSCRARWRRPASTLTIQQIPRLRHPHRRLPQEARATPSSPSS